MLDLGHEVLKQLVYVLIPAKGSVVVERHYISEARILEKLCNESHTIIRAMTNQRAMVLGDSLVWIDIADANY